MINVINKSNLPGYRTHKKLNVRRIICTKKKFN